MKTVIFGLIVLSVVLIMPAYADCGGDGYEPFITATNQMEEVLVTYDFDD